MQRELRQHDHGCATNVAFPGFVTSGLGMTSALASPSMVFPPPLAERRARENSSRSAHYGVHERFGMQHQELACQPAEALRGLQSESVERRCGHGNATANDQFVGRLPNQSFPSLR